MRGSDSKTQDVLNSLGECLDQAEKQMGLIASYKFQEKSVPKICFLQPERTEGSESYYFALQYLPSSLTSRKLRAPRLQKPQQDNQDLVNGYMGEFLNFHETDSSLYFRRTRFGCIGF